MGAREPAEHRMRPIYFVFPYPEGGEKTRLGGELRLEEQLLSRTGMCEDREGTVDDMSEGFLACLSSLSPARPESQGAEVRHVRLDQHKLTSLTNKRPYRGWSKRNIVETSDTFFFHIILCKKITYRFRK
jgi:hypothetical protein